MSGGSYDYAYSKVDEVDRWAELLDEMAGECRKWAVGDRATKYVDGQHVPFTLEDQARVVLAALRLERAAKKVREGARAIEEVRELMHTVEWIASCDYGVDALLNDEKT